MKELLTNEEIDSLLALFRAESGHDVDAPVDTTTDRFVARDEPEELRPISPLDLLKPNRFGRDRLQLLERLFASAAKSVASLLAERLRIDVTCDCIAVEQVRFANWRRQLEGPSRPEPVEASAGVDRARPRGPARREAAMGIWSIAAEPFESPMVLTMSSALLRGVVDRLLGGHGRAPDVQRLFTAAELAVAEAIVEPIVERLGSTLDDVVRVQPRIEGRSGNPATIQAMAPSDVALCTYFQIGGEVLHGDLHLAISYQDLEPFLERIADGHGASATELQGQHARVVSRAIRDVPADLSVVLGTTTLSLRALLDLRAGDVVRLDRLVERPLDGTVDGRVKFEGEVVRAGSSRGFRIDRVLPAPLATAGARAPLVPSEQAHAEG